jgi:hypothetical protein
MKCSLIISFFLFLGLLGCKQEQVSSSETSRVIAKDTMIQLMADLEIVESAIKLKQAQLQRDSLVKLSTMAFDSLYAYYKITPADFKYNLQFYQSDMALYQKMLDEMIIILSRKKDSISLELDVSVTDTVQVE